MNKFILVCLLLYKDDYSGKIMSILVSAAQQWCQHIQGRLPNVPGSILISSQHIGDAIWCCPLVTIVFWYTATASVAVCFLGHFKLAPCNSFTTILNNASVSSREKTHQLLFYSGIHWRKIGGRFTTDHIPKEIQNRTESGKVQHDEIRIAWNKVKLTRTMHYSLAGRG